MIAFGKFKEFDIEIDSMGVFHAVKKKETVLIATTFASLCKKIKFLRHKDFEGLPCYFIDNHVASDLGDRINVGEIVAVVEDHGERYVRVSYQDGTTRAHAKLGSDSVYAHTPENATILKELVEVRARLDAERLKFVNLRDSLEVLKLFGRKGR